MSNRRLIRVNELLKREIADYLYRIMNESGFDLSAVTVTHVITSTDLRRARVLVSIREHENDRDDMMRLIARHRKQIQQHLSKTVKIKYTPHLTFERDESLEQGDHVLELLRELDKESGEDAILEDGPAEKRGEPGE